MSARPSNREIINKVGEALQALRADKFMFATGKHIYGDLAGLELDSAEELIPLLIDLLEEINAAKPLDCYAGSYPPRPSYEPQILGLELWPYCWHSNRYGKRMYLKFALKKGCYCYVDCHESNL